jgi:class 3 adenylate cyclase
MVHYFLPHADSNYLFDAAVCALELKSAIARLSKEWQLRKNWLNELYLNVGLNEGQEWLGTFLAANSLEFVALGETVNASAHLSQMARFGQVWATKNFMSKLPAEHRDGLEFGVERVGAGGRHVLIRSSYSRVDDLVDIASERHVKLQKYAGLSVTEIRRIGSKNI